MRKEYQRKPKNFPEYEYHADGYLVFSKCFFKDKIGTRAGTIDNLGYRRVSFEGKLHLEHRVIWRILKGDWPTKELDHINRQRDDNRIENLREVTRQENTRNNGGKGIFEYHPGKWMVYFSGFYQSGFTSLDEAKKVHERERERLGFTK